MARTTARIDIHDRVTQSIIAAIEAGVDDWTMPWHRPGTSFAVPRNALTGQSYRGINILSLWIDADDKKYEQQIWATYKQYKELGAQVRAGAKASLIVKYGTWTPKAGKDSGKPAARRDGTVAADEAAERLYASPAWVFNIQQVDGATVPAAAPRPDLTTRLAHVDEFIAATKAEFRSGGQRAFYRHKGSDGDGDFIQMPPREYFVGSATSSPTESFESTRCHELLHWSGSEGRLDREFGKRFGDAAAAFEELVAEIGAAYLCAELDISVAVRPDHAQYVGHWLAVLENDSRAIFTAASQASKAVAYLFSLEPPHAHKHHQA